METFVELDGSTWVKNNGLSEKNEVVYEKATKLKNALVLVEKLNDDLEMFWDDWVRDGLLDREVLSDKNFFTFKAETIDNKGEWVAINSLHDVNISMAFPKSVSYKDCEHITDNLSLYLDANWNIEISSGGEDKRVWYFNIDYEFLNEFEDNIVDLQNKL